MFHGFAVSFDSKDDDNGEPGADLLRLPHWVAQELRRWEPLAGDQADDEAWCLDTLKSRPTWFTDTDLFASGVAPNDDSYRNSGFDRGHMAMKLLVERLGRDAAFNTHTVLNAIPQRPKFNQGIWLNLEYLTGAWAQTYGTVWVIQGPVFYQGKTLAWIGDEGERKNRGTGRSLQDRHPRQDRRREEQGGGSGQGSPRGPSLPLPAVGAWILRDEEGLPARTVPHHGRRGRVTDQPGLQAVRGHDHREESRTSACQGALGSAGGGSEAETAVPVRLQELDRQQGQGSRSGPDSPARGSYMPLFFNPSNTVLAQRLPVPSICSSARPELD